MEVRDLTARFAAFAARAPAGDGEALLRAWQEEVAAAHADVYDLYFRVGPGDSRRWREALPQRVAAADALAETADRAVGALGWVHDPVAAWLQLPVPPRVFCTVLVGDGATPAWSGVLRGRLTLLLDAAALPPDKALLRGLLAYELARFWHTLGLLGADNRAALPATAPERLPLGAVAVGHGLGAGATLAVVPGLEPVRALTHGRVADAAAWWQACERGTGMWAGRLAAVCAEPAAGAAERWFHLARQPGPGAPPGLGRHLAWRAMGGTESDPAVAPGWAAWPPDQAAARLRAALEVMAAAPGAEADR